MIGSLAIDILAALKREAFVSNSPNLASECRRRTASAGDDIRQPSAAQHPATARDAVSLALVRFAHEDTAALFVPVMLAGSGDDQDGLTLSEATRMSPV